MRGKYFNNPRPPKINRRDSDKVITATKKICILLSLMALRDEYGFGVGRLNRFMNKFQSYIDAYSEGYLDVYDINETLKEETGISVL